jgi:RNA polymerase sigma-70 factor (ECF subfamily)
VGERDPSAGPRQGDDVRAVEAALVRRCADGEREAWAAFVARFGPLVAGLSRRMLRRRTGHARDADVEEVAAEVFLALVRRDRLLLRRYDPRYRVSTYLGVICRSEVQRLLRRGRRLPAGLADPAAVPDRPERSAPSAGLEEAERLERVEAVRRALATLPDRDRLLLTLRYLEGVSYRAIAAALEVSPESVGPLLSRAKARLAAALGPEEGARVRSQGGGPIPP